MSAIISDCSQYRYLLYRDGTNPLLFCMLNPSTADSTLDDPTIRRCKRFAADNGFDGIVVVNMFAYRATDPKVLKIVPDPIGPLNDNHILEVALNHGFVVAAWGSNAPDDRVANVIGLFELAGTTTLCLGTTKDNKPRHPLYVRADQPLVEYDP